MALESSARVDILVTFGEHEGRIFRESPSLETDWDPGPVFRREGTPMLTGKLPGSGLPCLGEGGRGVVHQANLGRWSHSVGPRLRPVTTYWGRFLRMCPDKTPEDGPSAGGTPYPR